MPRSVDRPPCLDGLPHDRTAYVAVGTTHHARPGVLEALVDGLRGHGVNLVVTLGPGGDSGRLGQPDPAIRAVDWIAQEALLPHVDLVVRHGGAGTVLGALAHGRPLVVAPLATDQFDVAAQVATAGAGVVAGDGAPTADDVQRAFVALDAEPRCAAAAEALAARIATMPMPTEIVERLEARFSP